jgi:outer membrane protein OmpA-like peptidoglycan-associated protein
VRALALCLPLLAVTCLPLLARADSAFDAQRLHISPARSTGFIGVRSARTAGRRAYNASLWLETLADPLVLTDANGKKFASVVDNRLDLHFLFAYGLTDWLELGLDVPLILAQTGDEVVGADFPGDDAKAGIGPIRLVPRAELVSQRDDDTGFGLGLFVDVSLPTGKQSDFRSDGLKVEPGLALEYAWSHLRLAANGGYIVREQSRLGLLEHDDAVSAGAAAEVIVGGGFSLVPEFDYEHGIDAEQGYQSHRGRDFVGVARYLLKERLLFELGGGKGIKPHTTTPDWRFFGGISWVSKGKVRDGDGDGLPDDRDACSTEPEDRDGVDDGDGCPDPDNDGDGVPDARDGANGACANEPEDRDGFADDDGCPEPDDDRDGVADSHDGCRAEPEDHDGFADDDGCPELDNDRDGIPDTSDGSADARGFGICRDSAEDRDGVVDDDGCPEPEGPPQVAPVPVLAEAPAPTCTRVEFPENIPFMASKASPTPAGRKLVRALARRLKASPDVKSIRIEGHADEHGDALFNQSLSQRRALTVRETFVRLGVPQHMEVQGFGEDRPLSTNDSEEGRAQNRRAQVVVVDQAGCQ